MEPVINRKPFFKLFLCLISTGVFLSCGIEEYQYLPPVPSGNIQFTFQEQAVIQLPSVSASYFTHFTIFYRIYISDYSAPGTIQTSSTVLSSINPTLASDYFAIEPSTITTNNSSGATNASSLFGSRNYQMLNYEGAGAEVINNDGATLVIDFPPATGSIPSLTIDGSLSLNLYRSTGNGSFSPVPDRYFSNTSELNSSVNVTSTVNGDVVDNSAVSGTRSVFAAMYIVTTGLDQQIYTPIYSIPTFIGIFRLPD